jgi:hypothetical protein
MPRQSLVRALGIFAATIEAENQGHENRIREVAEKSGEESKEVTQRSKSSE